MSGEVGKEEAPRVWVGVTFSATFSILLCDDGVGAGGREGGLAGPVGRDDGYGLLMGKTKSVSNPSSKGVSVVCYDTTRVSAVKQLDDTSGLPGIGRKERAEGTVGSEVSIVTPERVRDIP